jgi:hypothetical protein
LDLLSFDQLNEWEAYDKIDPIGTWREDFRMAYLASIVTNLTIAVHGKQGAKAKTAIDFMPDWSGDPKEPVKQSVDEMIAIMTAVAGASNKKLERDKKLGIQPRTSNKMKL